MKQILSELLKKHKIDFSEIQLQKLCRLYELVVSYNEKINLTSITQKRDFAVLHILDSLILLKQFDGVTQVVDIGTGAGFPAFPLAIMLPNVNFTLIDSVNKKNNFHKIVTQELKLNNVISINARIEDFAKNNFENFDIVTARAVAKLPTLLEYSLPLLKLDGKLIAYKSNQIDEEIEQSENALATLGGKIESVLNFEFEDIKRCALIVKKVQFTPKKYPRSQNKPRLKPL